MDIMDISMKCNTYIHTHMLSTITGTVHYTHMLSTITGTVHYTLGEIY